MTSHDRQRRASADAPAARTRRPIQARLEVGPVDDPMEVEAEATADRVIAAIQTSGGPQPVAARKAPTEDELNGGGGPAADDEAKRAPVDSISRMDGLEEELPAQGFRIARVEEEELLQGFRIARVEEEELLQGSRVARAAVPVNDDRALEHEADVMGERAATMGSSQGTPTPATPAPPATTPPPAQAAVPPSTGDRDEEKSPVQLSRVARSSAIGADGGPVEADLESRLTAGGGAPLPEPVRATMESAFGADFSAVRVSENPAAAEIGALAYTTGADVRFAPGRFEPGSVEGQHLLAHELTHVVQQGAAPAAAARSTAQPDRDGER